MFLIRVFQNERFNRFLWFLASLTLNNGTLRKCYLVLRTIHFSAAMKTLVFGNLFKLFRLAITFAREDYHLGIKMKTNMTIVLFFSLSPTSNYCPCECDVNKLQNTIIAAEKWMVRSIGVRGLIYLQNGNLRRQKLLRLFRRRFILLCLYLFPK